VYLRKEKAILTDVLDNMARVLFRTGVICLCVMAFMLFFSINNAYAQGSLCSCENSQCMAVDCQLAKPPVREDHNNPDWGGEVQIIRFIQEEFNKYRDWITDWDPGCPKSLTQKCRGVIPSFFRGYFLPEAMEMTEQMSGVAHLQALTMGSIIDSKTQLETQRDFQELEFKAYKDYQPSRSFCAFGTGIRGAAHSEQRGKLNSVALAARQLDRHLGAAPSISTGVAGAAKLDDDRESRWAQFKTEYCDPRDNDYKGASTGLKLVCSAAGDRTNRDIDFTRVIEHERTLDVNFSKGGSTPTADEADVLALSSNIYGHDVFDRNVDEQFLDDPVSQELYLMLRSVMAKRSVAENSYNAIVGLKSQGTTNIGSTRDYLGAVIKELGVSNAEIYKMIGTNPSYYAQLEILARKLYQNTDFYTDLYTSPTNIARKGVAMKAIDLMLDRAIYESELRQELATSVVLSARLQKRVYPALRNNILNVGGG
jgi:hypothetical protein